MLKRKHTKASDWLPVIQEWKSSGLNKKAFCEQRAINYKTFYRWHTQLARSILPCESNMNLQKPAQSNGFVPIEIKDIVKENNLCEKPCVLRLSTQLQLQIPMTAINVDFLKTLFAAAEVKSC